MKSGVIQRWGLVEFQSSSEAETTLDLLNGQLINGQPIRVQVINGTTVCLVSNYYESYIM
jgi:RNA recognition motif-containing protein